MLAWLGSLLTYNSARDLRGPEVGRPDESIQSEVIIITIDSCRNKSFEIANHQNQNFREARREEEKEEKKEGDPIFIFRDPEA